MEKTLFYAFTVIHVHQVVSLLLLFVLEKEQCISDRNVVCFTWCTVIPITCSSASLVIFVNSIHLYCYSIVDAVALIFLSFCWQVTLIVFSPHRVGVPCSFQFVQVIFNVPSCIRFLILNVFYVSSSVGFTITSFLEKTVITDHLHNWFFNHLSFSRRLSLSLWCVCKMNH